MRKAQWEGILDFIKNLQEAHEEIQRAVRRKEYPSVLKMLQECQDFAISLGEIIENTEGEGHAAIAHLERYCEALFRVYEEVREAADSNKSQVNESKLHKFLKQQLIWVENSIKNDISVKSEIVFLPYKASMWDSLESIWMEERKKPENDAYVVPIPYYDKNPDGSFHQMHYEGGQYPEYVAITDWQKYSLMERRPDIIYIHNPYDQYNYVTSVHPDFYAARLKQYTNMLVYCPYFVGIHGSVAEHFCTLPGVLYADRVIVESEEIRKKYTKAIRKYESENRCIGLFGNLDEKIKVSQYGSPKVDRVKRTTRDSLNIPAEWERLIQGENGTRRRVVLYNITVDAALKNSDVLLAKIRKVLSVFQEKKGVVLLWRPHPLLLSTLYSMRPELYREMVEIIERYQDEGWGIYDDTADIDRAIVLSDAYYGDMSSVVTLYQATGKPMMIQDYRIDQSAEAESLYK